MIADLDLMVSGDSAVAHVAGQWGATWTLIYEPADWRWMTRREDGPWYPTMRLFRQRPCAVFALEGADIAIRTAAH